MEDWFHQMSNPCKIKNLLTYLLTYTIEGVRALTSFSPIVSKLQSWVTMETGFLIQSLKEKELCNLFSNTLNLQ